VSYRCTRNVPRTVRATVAARRSLVHVHVSRTYDHHGHGHPRRAVKASQSSFHCCSLHRRVGNTRRFERKSNPRKGQRTARTRPGTHDADAYTYVHTHVSTHTHTHTHTYIYIYGKTYSHPAMNSSNVRANDNASPRGSSAWRVCLRLVTRHAA